jgi:hypothetical protein
MSVLLAAAAARQAGKKCQGVDRGETMDISRAYRGGWGFILLVSLFVLTARMAAAAGPEEAAGSGLPRFSLKIAGGLGALPGRGGDLDLLRLHVEGFYAMWDAETYYATTFDWEPMTRLTEWPVELVVLLKPRLGIGLGSGLMTAANAGSYTWDYDRAAFLYGSGYADDNHIETRHDFKFRIIPAYLNLYIFQPIGALTVYSYGGIGMYWGKMTHSSTIDYELKSETRSLYSTPPSYRKREEYGNIAIEENLRKGSLGFQGGVGGELTLFKRFSLGLEISGRHLVFAGWQGSSSAETTTLIKNWDQYTGWSPDVTEHRSVTKQGMLWYSQVHDPLLGQDIDAFVVEGPGISESALVGARRQARIDLSSIAILLTLRIHFGRSF